MKEVNLLEIAIKNMACAQITEGVLKAMSDACEQTIELLIDNIENCTHSHEGASGGYRFSLDKKELEIKTKNQIK